jgi:hypothetical protein
MIINKDLIYLICVLIIFCNVIIYNKTKNEFPKYSFNYLYKIIFLLLVVFIIMKNIYVGLFLSMTYLIINEKLMTN